MKKASKIRHS